MDFTVTVPEKLKYLAPSQIEEMRKDSLNAYWRLFELPSSEAEIPDLETLQLYGTQNLRVLQAHLEQKQRELSTELAKLNCANETYCKEGEVNPQLCCTLLLHSGDRLGLICDQHCPTGQEMHRQLQDDIRQYFEDHDCSAKTSNEIATLTQEIIESYSDRHCVHQSCVLVIPGPERDALLAQLQAEIAKLQNTCSIIQQYIARIKDTPESEVPLFVDYRDLEWLGTGEICLFITPDDTSLVKQICRSNPDFIVGHGAFIPGYLHLPYPPGQPANSGRLGLLHGSFSCVLYDPLSPQDVSSQEATMHIEEIDVRTPFLLRPDEIAMLLKRPDTVAPWFQTNYHSWNIPEDTKPFYEYFHSLAGNG